MNNEPEKSESNMASLRPQKGLGDAYVGFHEGYWKDIERYFIITMELLPYEFVSK